MRTSVCNASLASWNPHIAFIVNPSRLSVRRFAPGFSAFWILKPFFGSRLTIFAYWTILEQSYASPQIFLERTDRAHCRLPEARAAPGEVRPTGRAAPCQ